MKNKYIQICNATQNNLKNVSVKIPKHQLTVVTGVSGSGKSSLVFDTLAAESRRELNDTFSSYIQHMLPKYGRPTVEKIENLPVAIPIEQKKLSANSRSTVGTYTEIYTFLRLLFSRVGKPFIGYSDSFSFNHPDGKCPICDGLGYVTEMDIHKLIDFNKSLNESPIDFPTFGFDAWRWKRYAYSGLFDLDKKIKDYSPEELELLLNAPQQKLKNPPAQWPKTALYEGIIPRMNRSILHKDDAKRHKKQIDSFVTTKICPECRGNRVNRRVRSCKINGKSIADTVQLSLEELVEFIETIDIDLAQEIKEEILSRLHALINIGLNYLTLGRSTGSLSGGEAQRIRIAKHITNALNDVLYVLDEPSAGLHPKDIDRIKMALRILRDKGNTVVLVEHNPQLIEIADYIIDVGPKAGEAGGEIQFTGSYADFMKQDTATSIAIRSKVALKTKNREPKGMLAVKNVTGHNLQGFSTNIPLQTLTVLCGVAGSGKSSLGEEILQAAIEQELEVVSISQKSIGVNLRSTPLTYLNIFGDIRQLFAEENNVSPALFSYNSQGACPHCKGKGVIVSNMAFMDDVVTTCESCQGTRYKPEVLSYTYRNKTIVNILDMTVTESRDFFNDTPFKNKLQTIVEVGLGYLRLHQSLSTLSGGELQRLKLANQLYKKGALYLLDEPTDGLHLTDINNLLNLFNQLVDNGNTVVLLEHHLSAIRQADWLIELGPEGGTKGGKLMFEGTPLELANSGDKITGIYL
ncbi:excinuclease ABC subunit A [Enterococcus sp. 7E2_DIV0204]|uniref:ATP-binding cassette domain-containing protein n=1 Tax=unclassified Enterococcus TaxID=2608891 RepID=UPI000A32FD54|nr:MULTISPECIES: excinuclease ABC subunit UvrA [unclassified Enterococcus]OTN89318.1 excinuclease ABC subunit A [Enterococcus sp. 7E2_DIV0204]OTP51764.1 excinuclease ABC subunit A [Enterococcus sp. 7D2_DIV0200]